jgi:hypothetical protein
MKDFHNQKLIEAMAKLKEESYPDFADMVLGCLKEEPDFAVNDTAPVEDKLSALGTLRKYYESVERFEDCAFIAGLEKRITDAEKR